MAVEWSDAGTAAANDAAIREANKYADPVSSEAIQANAEAWDTVETTSAGFADVMWNAVTGVWERVKAGASKVTDLAGATIDTATQTVKATGKAAEGIGNVGLTLPWIIGGVLVVIVLVAQSGAVRASIRR